MVRHVVCIALGLVLAGCSTLPRPPAEIRTVEVKVPVPVRRDAPGELLTPLKPGALPRFVSPADPKASSALTPDGERSLKEIIADLLARDAAWRAWATTP